MLTQFLSAAPKQPSAFPMLQAAEQERTKLAEQKQQANAVQEEENKAGNAVAGGMALGNRGWQQRWTAFQAPDVSSDNDCSQY